MRNINEKKQHNDDKIFKRWMIFALICCLMLVGIAFVGTYKVKKYRGSEEAEEYVWQECTKKNTYLEYSKYIVSYPHGKYNKEALKRMDELKEEKPTIKQ